MKKPMKSPLGDDFAELVGADDAAGAADVPDDDRGLAGNVVRQVLGDDAALDIGRAARRVVDDHRDGLALVELGKRGVGNDDESERCRTGSQKQCP